VCLECVHNDYQARGHLQRRLVRVTEPLRQPEYEFEGFRLDAQRRVLFGPDDQAISLTPRLFDALLFFVERPGQLLSKKQLLEAIWPRVVVEEHNLNKTISELRHVLGEKPGEHKFFVTKPGHGYRFVAGVSTESVLAPTPVAAAPAKGVENKTGELAPAARNDLLAAKTSRPWPSRKPQVMVASVAAFAVAALAAGMSLRVFDTSTSRSDRGLHVTPLFFERDGGETPQAVLSTLWKPDGKAIAFTASRNGQPQPYVLYLDGSSAQPLTRGFSGMPRQWTPAGEVLLAMIRPDAPLDPPGLWSVPAVGGQPEPLFMFPAGTTPILSLTADGSTVAALRRDEGGVWGVWTGSVARGVLERYEPAPFEAGTIVNLPDFAFSPDGRNLLLMWNRFGEGEQAWLLPYPPDPRRPPRRVLDTLPYHSTTPKFSWLPDNRHIVLTIDVRGKKGRLYLADTVSGKFRPLTDDTGTAWQIGPVVSPDGTRVVFSEVDLNLDIVTINVHTAAVSPVIATNRREQMPAWTADGKRFVYVTDRSGAPEIWLHEQDIGERPLVTARDFPPGTTDFFMAPSVSPDGTRVMYQRVSGDVRGAMETHLWMSSLAGGAPMRLRDGAEQQVAGSWSPDGAWYAYEEMASDGTRVLKKVRVSGTSEPETLSTGIHPYLGAVPVWSPDGSWILFDNDRLELVAADGSETRDLGLKEALCTFARAGNLFYCIDGLAGGSSNLVEKGFEGTARVVGAVAKEHLPNTDVGPALRLSLTPDGEGVTYSVGRSHVQLMLGSGLADVSLP
jgi:Tol biopolymer transport system component/DNA-binding winged helix-turn-helix (wHTH) protein